MNPTAFIQTLQLNVDYGNHSVLKDISLPIFERQITAIVGPSGCGKTSFLMCLNRLIEMIPTANVEGEILMGDISLLNSNINLIGLRRQIGMIFQKPNPFPFSIQKNIELPLKEHGVSSKSARLEIMEKVLKDVGLWIEVKDRLHKSAMDLSGGQQQRLCIARALALRPQVLLMDEPCSALDPIASGVVEDLILKLKRNYTVVIVTHNLAQAKRISDYTAMFWLIRGVGRLIEFGKTKDVFENPRDEITASYVSGLRG